MEGDLIYYELKLQSLLEKFLENGYHMKNDVYCNRLLSFLGGKENKELAEVLLKLPLLTEWILRAISSWENNNSQDPDHSVSAFALQLLGFLSKNEPTFCELSQHDVYNRVINILRIKNSQSLPSVKLGFIKFMTSIISHPSGLRWMLQTTYWQDILALSLQNQTVYITKEGHLFMASFLDELLDHDLNICSNIWETIIAPLLTKPDDIFRNQENFFEVCDEKIERVLGPTVSLIIDILEYFIDKVLEKDNHHVKKFKGILKMPQLVGAIINYLQMVRNQNTAYEIGRVWVLLLYFSMVAEVQNGILKPDIDKEFMEPIFSLFNILLEGSKFLCISKYLYIVSVWWFKIKGKIRIDYQIESDEKFIFENQFLVPQLAHNYIFCKAVIFKNDFKEMDVREDFVTKIFSRMGKLSIRWCFKWRNAVPADEVAFNVGPKAISYILQLKSLLNRDSAVMVFQSLLHVLVDLNSILSKNNHLFPMFSKCEAYLKTFLETLTEFIIHFKISWRDSIESLCVFQSSVEFLKIAPWSSNLVIADLNLIKVGINNYLSPSMALLIDTHDSCASYILCSILQNKLHDPEWSVRDTALEVVSAIAVAARIEFQSFQKILMTFDLCTLVLTVSLQDGQSFVRASAMKCLTHLIQIRTFWKGHLESQGIVEKIMMVLRCETEGIVRAQAATLLTRIFEYHDIEASVQEEIFTCMSSAAIDDLHWEVRLNSLSFWNNRVQQVLKNQGMVDGQFPKCTFSKESKKIVILTDEEIKRRIMKALDHLSVMNCLTVLKHAISDDCDLQVSKRGLEVSKILVDLLEKYDIAGNVMLEEKGPPSNDSCYSSIVPSTPSPSCQSRDEIIDKILEASDSSLLKGVYNPGNDYSTNVIQIRNTSRQKISSIEFIVSTKKDYKSLVNDREKWMNSLDSLSSLLNDMLENYELSDTNAMDCY